MRKLLYLMTLIVFTACVFPHTVYASEDNSASHSQEDIDAIHEITNLTNITADLKAADNDTDNYIDEAVNMQTAAVNDYIEKHQLALAEIEHKFDVYYTMLGIATVILAVIPLFCLISITKSFKKIASSLDKLAETNENLLK